MGYKKIRWIRKLLALFIFIFALVYYFNDKSVMIYLMLSLFVLFFPFYLLNYLGYNKNIFVRSFMKLYPKKDEEKRTVFPSDVVFFISTIFLTLLFSKEVVIYSLIILTFSDNAEQIFGIFFKSKNLAWNNDKNYSGLIGGFIFAIIPGILFSNILNFNFSYYLILLSSIVAAFAGTVKKYDNEIIPWSTAIVLSLI